MKLKAAFHTLGCKVNQYETDAMIELFVKSGYEICSFDEVADVYVINTCTVTNFGDKKSRQVIRRAKRLNKNSVLAVCGCYSQVYEKEVQAIEDVDIIIGTKGRNDIVSLVNEYLKNKLPINTVSEIGTDFEELEISKTNQRTRAYVKIEDGCNRFCTYCIIPYARGRVRCRELDDIVKEVNTLSSNDYKEIVLTGIHLASYKKGFATLIDVIKAVNNIDGIERVRLGSLEPTIITADFANELSKLSKICPSFHLSLQSGSDKILKLMNRNYTIKQYLDSVEILKSAFCDVSFTTDIITGFPNETYDDFKQSMDLSEKVGFMKVHAFPYSKKKGTVAAQMQGQISNEEKSKRTAQLIDLSNKLNFEYLSKYIGKTLQVLFEDSQQEHYLGHTKNYMPVKVKSDRNNQNQLRNVKIKSALDGFLHGEIV